MYTKMREQTTLAVEEADHIIFLMDGNRAGAVGYRVSHRLRASGKPVIYAVNKLTESGTSSPPGLLPSRHRCPLSRVRTARPGFRAHGRALPHAARDRRTTTG
jgi:hypothetical protein